MYIINHRLYIIGALRRISSHERVDCLGALCFRREDDILPYKVSLVIRRGGNLPPFPLGARCFRREEQAPTERRIIVWLLVGDDALIIPQKNKHHSPKQKSNPIGAFCHSERACESRNLINQRHSRCISSRQGLVYHQNIVLHIIIAKQIQPTVDDIHLRR